MSGYVAHNARAMSTRPGWLRRQLWERAGEADARTDYMLAAWRQARDDIEAMRVNLAATARDDLAGMTTGSIFDALDLIAAEVDRRHGRAVNHKPVRHVHLVEG